MAPGPEPVRGPEGIRSARSVDHNIGAGRRFQNTFADTQHQITPSQSLRNETERRLRNTMMTDKAKPDGSSCRPRTGKIVRAEQLVATISRLTLAVSTCLLVACGPKIYDEVDLMPSPTLYAEANVDPFEDISAGTVYDRAKLFYVTDRAPVEQDDPQAYYSNERGHLLRGGIARVRIDPPLDTWEDIRRITLQGNRKETYKLRLSEVHEYGVFPFSLTRYFAKVPSQEEMQSAGRQFAAQIDAQLARSRNKDIFIYTHGYNVDFDYSMLVSKELQHFLGYQGAFVSYNWTATPSRLAYFRDQESVLSTRRNLRSLIEYLSANTSARRIHLVGYSAGTRLVFEAAYQIALQPEPRARLGRLILIGSDLDTSFVLQSLDDGLLDAVEDVTFYQSETDSALAMSRFIFGRERIGQTRQKDTLAPSIVEGLARTDGLNIVDVTDAKAANTGNGHWYFRSSPWASSDLFISLLTNRDPIQRGLVRAPGEVVWRFPPNYPEFLKSQKLIGPAPVLATAQ